VEITPELDETEQIDARGHRRQRICAIDTYPRRRRRPAQHINKDRFGGCASPTSPTGLFVRLPSRSAASQQKPPGWR